MNWGRLQLNRERSLILVRGHRAQRVPPELREVAGTSVVALVLSTQRSDSPDLVVDHALWFACMEAVGTVVGAASAEVLLEPQRGFWAWLRGRKTRSAGALSDYFVRVQAGSEGEDWQTVLWRKESQVLAAATCERWYQVGGPAPYHDSYTTSIFLARAAAARLLAVLQVSVTRAGGHIADVIDAPPSVSGAATTS